MRFAANTFALDRWTLLPPGSVFDFFSRGPHFYWTTVSLT